VSAAGSILTATRSRAGIRSSAQPLSTASVRKTTPLPRYVATELDLELNPSAGREDDRLCARLTSRPPEFIREGCTINPHDLDRDGSIRAGRIQPDQVYTKVGIRRCIDEAPKFFAVNTHGNFGQLPARLRSSRIEIPLTLSVVSCSRSAVLSIGVLPPC